MALSTNRITLNNFFYYRSILSGVQLRWSSTQTPEHDKLSEAPPFDYFIRRGGEKFPGYSKKPFPYKSRSYTVFDKMGFDRPMERYTSQCKVITVEGTVGIGKNELAKRIAKEFDLHYQRGVQNDDLWINRSTLFDYRQFNEVVDKEARLINFKDLYSADELFYGQVERMQANVMEYRILAYGYGMLHLFSTGQGFTGVRSPWSDYVMADAMWKKNWVTPGFATWYHSIMDRLKGAILKPHLTVYLHCPAKIALEKIKHREANDPTFVAGKNLDLKFLEQIENRYKRWLDDEADKDGEVLYVDWSEEPDEAAYEEIYEEIQALDLDGRSIDCKKFEEWRQLNNKSARDVMTACTEPTKLLDLMYEFPPVLSREYALPTLKGRALHDLFEQHPMGYCVRNEMNSTPAERYGAIAWPKATSLPEGSGNYIGQM